jgi:hypothetical protein
LVAAVAAGRRNGIARESTVWRVLDAAASIPWCGQASDDGVAFLHLFSSRFNFFSLCHRFFYFGVLILRDLDFKIFL